MSVAMLKLEGVRRTFHGTHAVDGIDLTVDKGEFVALMGPSGCGKTTTVRLIAGLERPDAGTIAMWDRRIDTLEPWEREAPLVWQNYALFPFMSVRKNVEFGLKQRGVPRRARREKGNEWLERLGIAQFAERQPAALSGGQRQRVALARALALEPEMILLDEPLSALDPHLRGRMQAELVDLNKRLGITFVYITHSESEAFAMADRVVVMNAGRIEQVGAPRVIHRAPRTRFVAEFLGGNNVVDAVAAGGTLTSDLGPVAAEPGPAGDGPVTLVVPADLIRLNAETPGENTVPATVRTVELSGSLVTATLVTDSGAELVAQMPLHDLERAGIAPGSAVTASWRAADTLILTDPTTPRGQ